MRGITAGSGFATSELRLLLQGVIERVQRNWSASVVDLKLYVDDLTIATEGTPAEVTNILTGAADFAVRSFEELGMKVSKSKSCGCRQQWRPTQVPCDQGANEGLTTSQNHQALGHWFLRGKKTVH